MGFCTSLFLFVASISVILAQNVEESYLVINGSIPLAHTDASYICATIDWWPSNKCDYHQCPWGSSSALNLVRMFLECFLFDLFYSNHPINILLND